MYMRALLFLLTVAGVMPATAEFMYVGSYRVSDGPYWGSNPPVYSGVEAAALLFGGSPSKYAISVNASTNPSTITHTAWVDGHAQPWAIVAETYKRDSAPAGYYQPGGDAISAYVRDHVDYSKVNYVWAQTEAVPEPSTALLLLGGVGLMAAVRKRRMSLKSGDDNPVV
jgi:hypothetical protein